MLKMNAINLENWRYMIDLARSGLALNESIKT